MLAATHLPDRNNAEARLARMRGIVRVGGLARLLALLAAALAPALAAGDIYKWTDEQGHLVVSDVPPVDPGKVSGMKLLAASSKRAAQAPAAGAASDRARDAQAIDDGTAAAVSRREQELEARVEELERQLQEQQSVPQAVDAGDYYPAPPPPPPQQDDYASYGQAYYPSYYPGYYYPPPAYAVVVVPARPVLHRPVPPSRPAFLPRPVSGKRPVFTGPAPTFTGPTAQFTGPNPRFVGPTPQFVGPNPKFVGSKPQFVGGPPQFTSHAPQVQNRPLQPANAQPHPVGPRLARR